jgi:hypothetical protein
MLALAALVATIQVARAEQADPHAAFVHAIQLYLAGDAVKARDALQDLLAEGPALPPEVRREALAWLGDLLYAEGRPTAARNAFEALLDEQPDYPLDPSAHSPEVVAYFEEVRAQVAAARGPEIPPPPTFRDRGPWPWKVLLPGGAFYFTEHEPVSGAVVGGLQLAGLGVSLGTWIELRSHYPNGGVFPIGSDAELRDFQTLAWVNRATAAAGCLAYLVPIAVETGGWAGRRNLMVSVGPTSVTFVGRF